MARRATFKGAATEVRLDGAADDSNSFQRYINVVDVLLTEHTTPESVAGVPSVHCNWNMLPNYRRIDGRRSECDELLHTCITVRRRSAGKLHALQAGQEICAVRGSDASHSTPDGRKRFQGVVPQLFHL